MIDRFVLAFFFLLVPFSFFAIFGWAFVYHIRTYGFKEKANRKICLVFTLITLAFALSILFKFLAVDWDSASFPDFLRKSGINSFRSSL